MEMPRTDVPLAVLIFVLAVWGVTGVLCLVNWYRRRGAGVAFLEILRFTTMGLILFTLCKPEYDRELPREEDKEIDVVILADRSGSMATATTLRRGSTDPRTRSCSRSYGPSA